jgi:hypothetical protein
MTVTQRPTSKTGGGTNPKIQGRKSKLPNPEIRGLQVQPGNHGYFLYLG